jgi:hypothetical protein
MLEGLPMARVVQWLRAGHASQRPRRLLARRLFVGRLAQGEPLLDAAELERLCAFSAPMLPASLGALAPAYCAPPVPPPFRWGHIPNLVCDRLHADGSCYLHHAAAISATAAPPPAPPPLEQPVVYLALEWPTVAERWRQLDATAVWPAVQRTLRAAQSALRVDTRPGSPSHRSPYTCTSLRPRNAPPAACHALAPPPSWPLTQ